MEREVGGDTDGDIYGKGRLSRVLQSEVMGCSPGIGILRKQEQQWKSWDLSVKQAVSLGSADSAKQTGNINAHSFLLCL